MKLRICFRICLSSNGFHPRLFFFFKAWADNDSTNQYSCQLLYGWRMPHFVLFYLKMYIVGEGPGETPPALRCFFYLIRSLLTRKSHGWRSLVGCSPWGHWGSDTSAWPHFHFSLSCVGEGNGNLLQCSRLENLGAGEPGGLPSVGSHRVGHDWSDLAAAATDIKYLAKN